MQVHSHPVLSTSGGTRSFGVGGGGKEGACLGETEVGLALGRGGDLFGLPAVPGTLNVVWYGES